MTPLPFWSLLGENREVGLVVSVFIGFGFGFVLERAGFGRAQKLVGQFLLSEMTVLKVMFGAVATAMVGLVVLDGLGVIELRAVADSASSPTWIWPLAIGGFVVGLGFVTSAYCPGTSVVAMASGKLDGAATVVGVVLGTLVGGELLAIPAVARFNVSGDLGHLYLFDLLGVPAAVVALGVALVAVAAFVGAEKIEAIFGGEARPESPARPRRAVFATLAGLGAAGVVLLALPHGTPAAYAPLRLEPEALARRIVDAHPRPPLAGGLRHRAGPRRGVHAHRRAEGPRPRLRLAGARPRADRRRGPHRATRRGARLPRARLRAGGRLRRLEGVGAGAARSARAAAAGRARRGGRLVPVPERRQRGPHRGEGGAAAHAGRGRRPAGEAQGLRWRLQRVGETRPCTSFTQHASTPSSIRTSTCGAGRSRSTCSWAAWPPGS
jgi:uncharacterized membrane protein YedE/YeeE